MENRFFPNYEKYLITSPFGPRASGYHYGIDLVAKSPSGGGATDYITAHTGGTVEECGYNDTSGNYIRIRVDDRTVMSYCHFQQRLRWEKGQIIETGDILGYMGSTGRSTGAHLHWGIKVDGQWIDPAPYLDKDYLAEEAKAEAQTVSVTLPVIRYADRGEAVKAMQALLILRGFSCGNCGADGIYGAGTKAALTAFQGRKGMEKDAVCGQKTWAALIEN